LLFFQRLLLPLSFIYQGILRLRNHLYDSGFFGSTEFDIPTINVGNLAFGGTGKTPHIEYLIRLLQNQYRVAVLSRGYKRKTIGYVFAQEDATPFSIGDEPFQIYSKFSQVEVAVSENRVLGIPSLLMDAPYTDLILLDDAYQHRDLKPGLNILLTEQHKLYVDDFLVPSGYLREYAEASNRADIIVVTKCDPNLSISNQQQITRKLKPLSHQKVYFSFIQYGQITPFFEGQSIPKKSAVLALAGIANPQIFEAYLKQKYEQVWLMAFPDHHLLTDIEINKVFIDFDLMPQQEKIIVCTEKDYQKLIQAPYGDQLKKYPFFYLPIEVVFFEEDKGNFDQNITHYVERNRSYH